MQPKTRSAEAMGQNNHIIQLYLAYWPPVHPSTTSKTVQRLSTAELEVTFFTIAKIFEIISGCAHHPKAFMGITQ